MGFNNHWFLNKIFFYNFLIIVFILITIYSSLNQNICFYLILCILDKNPKKNMIFFNDYGFVRCSYVYSITFMYSFCLLLCCWCHSWKKVSLKNITNIFMGMKKIITKYFINWTKIENILFYKNTLNIILIIGG